MHPEFWTYCHLTEATEFTQLLEITQCFQADCPRHQEMESLSEKPYHQLPDIKSVHLKSSIPSSCQVLTQSLVWNEGTYIFLYQSFGREKVEKHRDVRFPSVTARLDLNRLIHFSLKQEFLKIYLWFYTHTHNLPQVLPFYDKDKAGCRSLGDSPHGAISLETPIPSYFVLLVNWQNPKSTEHQKWGAWLKVQVPELDC